MGTDIPTEALALYTRILSWEGGHGGLDGQLPGFFMKSR
jgi:hypothetical protein